MACVLLFYAVALGCTAEVQAREPQTPVARLTQSVNALAQTIGPRCIETPKALAQAEQWVAAQLKRATGLAVTRLPYRVGAVEVANIEVVIPGTDPKAPAVVLGAHYDSVRTTPGADDNASGVAALIEIARHLKARTLKRTVRLVGFVNEEPPYFKTDAMGSLVYAKHLKGKGVAVHAMIALDMLGYYDDTPGSQKYPPVIGRFYPKTANFVAFVGDMKAAPMIQGAKAAFSEAVPFPVESIAAPRFVEGIDFSDHWSFWQQGYPGFMITDTAFFRSAHYHQPTDTPATLDFARLASVTRGIQAVVEHLAAQ
ncbi:MAG: Zn-dependent M28 family amino/carboxypeptidase [Bradymonadia bacterium]|jgi:Zn-dependent M28 family amino/carboxypeptidase